MVFSTAPHSDDTLHTLWRYRIGDEHRTPFVVRRNTDRAYGTRDPDLHEDMVAWYDSAIAPAGLYAMSIEGGPVIGLTDNECPCYGGPRIWERQVVYQGWQEGFSNVCLVDIDTLDERNLSWEEYELTGEYILQTWPAFDGEWVVWKDSRNDPAIDPAGNPYNSDIYGMRLPDGPREPLCTHPAVQLRPDVHQGLVAWEDYRNAADPHSTVDLDDNVDIYMLDLETRVEQQVTSLPGRESHPRIWGRRLFFVAEDLIGQDAVFMVDLEEAGLVVPGR
jgi:hypothetical protein